MPDDKSAELHRVCFKLDAVLPHLDGGRAIPFHPASIEESDKLAAALLHRYSHPNAYAVLSVADGNGFWRELHLYRPVSRGW